MTICSFLRYAHAIPKDRRVVFGIKRYLKSTPIFDRQRRYSGGGGSLGAPLSRACMARRHPLPRPLKYVMQQVAKALTVSNAVNAQRCAGQPATENCALWIHWMDIKMN